MNYLQQLKTEFPQTRPIGELTKPSKAPSVSIVSTDLEPTSEKSEETAGWDNATKATLEATEERVAIVEYDGGLTRVQAERWGELAEAFQRAKKTGVDFALVSVNDSARRVIELARLDKVFTIHATLADGL